jgi:hypothetical protein
MVAALAFDSAAALGDMLHLCAFVFSVPTRQRSNINRITRWMEPKEIPHVPAFSSICHCAGRSNRSGCVRFVCKSHYNRKRNSIEMTVTQEPIGLPPGTVFTVCAIGCPHHAASAGFGSSVKQTPLHMSSLKRWIPLSRTPTLDQKAALHFWITNSLFA